MDWFERLTGFRETDYDVTRERLEVDGGRLRSRVNGKSYAIGALELVPLRTLRERVRSGGGPSGRIKVRVVTGDVRRLHQLPEYAGALFQVASQFNLLEMVSPEVTPEHGVTRYQHDGTQGPACAMAAGAATIYRNYLPRAQWQSFASLVLESAYEATLWAAVDNAQRGGTNIVLLTRLGGGAFGNDDNWIDRAMRRAIQQAAELGIDVRLVSYGPPSRALLQLADEFS